MAGPRTPQQHLDQIATLIARDLVAEVCSIYVSRAGDILELFATEGLHRDAVHRTRLMIGEGLVGFVAAQAMPVALAEAQAHPLFAYQPETGEESYSSLMGTPILRGGRVIGVLVVQNRTPRSYADEEVEVLETIAMVRATYPDVETQTDFYQRVIQQADGRPITFRTLDIGGDKLLPYLRFSKEDNPAMGWRATRIALDRPAMLRHQLRALLKANGGGRLSVMFPMIAQVAEFDAARRLLDMEADYLQKRGLLLPDDIRVGVMLEVPALAMQLPVLLPLVDFVSIGINDLVQFLFASDRGNPRLEGGYDPLSPAILTFIAQVSDACRAADVPLTVCGEIAGDPLAAMALIGIGIRELSMSPANVEPVKAMVLSLNMTTMSSYLDSLLTSASPSIRSHLRFFARDHGITV